MGSLICFYLGCFSVQVTMGKIKPTKRQFFAYSEEDMQKAIEAVKNGMTKKKAAIEYSVPRSTLLRKLSGHVPLRRKMGPPSELSETEENVLVEWILAMAKKGFPVHKVNLLQSVKKYLVESGKNVRYLNESLTPGRAWFEGFLKRHPNIKEKHAESVSKARAAVTEDRIRGWFNEVLEYFKEKKLEGVLLDPSRIFNGDESGFALCPKTGKVLGPTQIKEDFYERVSNEKEQITVMGTFSADGKVVPPMLIFPYKKMPRTIVESIPENWALGRSDSGWMNSEVFFEYIANHFLPYLKSSNIIKPIVLFVDGHRSHLTQQTSKLCDDNGIILISLFPNTTHITQPADVSVFKPLKAGWKTAVRNWKFENFPKDVTRYTFGCIIKQVFDTFATAKTIQNGFRKSGLYPFDEKNVDYSKCIPNRPIQFAKEIKTASIKGLEVIEKKIEKKELDLFLRTYANKSNWSGSNESLNLYKVWASLKDDCEPRMPCTAEDENVLPESLATPQNSPIDKGNVNDTTVVRELSPIASTSATRTHDSPAKHQSTTTIWQTPDRDNILTYEKKESEGYKVPTPFKKCLPFPHAVENKTPPRRKRAIFPAVVSSEKYRKFYENEQKKSWHPNRNGKKNLSLKMTFRLTRDRILRFHWSTKTWI